ncbi:hypothetical protein GQ600_13720 [Phytophthora cactorum]|nr:hypothetical protein GQ600_13720 [Phytophthora cactorum]
MGAVADQKLVELDQARTLLKRSGGSNCISMPWRKKHHRSGPVSPACRDPQSLRANAPKPSHAPLGDSMRNWLHWFV